ncbi:magnesium-translocating P-type ATPase [Desulfitobacterium sp. Sab5]|uniref:magnesium-translocating P-type ATPase n=1 Tax=Desulfitobacterium nosdiversum TaxID=3375356 RepID=UPI003CEC6E35
MDNDRKSFWSYSADSLFQEMQSRSSGLSTQEVDIAKKKYGLNVIRKQGNTGTISLLLNQFKSPIIIILLFAAGLSAFLGDASDTQIIVFIILVSGLLSFWQERGAKNAVESLLAVVDIKCTVLRDKLPIEISTQEIIPGDVILLKAGDVIPGDSYLLEETDLFVSEATLTGETYPVEKRVDLLPEDTPLAQRTNSLWMGTHVISGTAKALVVFTGEKTEFGRISERLRLKPPETDFTRGVRKFGYLLLEVTLILVLLIFAINVYFARPVLEAFLFSLALAVGLTPQLLPAIISINLAHGAKRMAEKKVIVKRLDSIENFGSMNVLCSDKTGTLTEGTVHLHSVMDAQGRASEKALFYAYINAFYESGYSNPIDEAIKAYRQFDLADYRKIEEIPYDFTRKKLSILVEKDQRLLMVTKGTLTNILEICSTVEIEQGNIVNFQSDNREKVQQNYQDLSTKGLRVLGLAYKEVDPTQKFDREQEKDMTFLGLLVLYDPPKDQIVESIAYLKELGVSLKMITGDNKFVAAAVAQEIGIQNAKVLTGSELSRMSNTALLHQVNQIDVFAETEPNSKERIVLALRKAGNVVGYIGDGINDVSALHSADVGVTVESAVDVAKGTADIVLLEKSLNVLADGVKEGRKTFTNTLKYIFMATSANFGNMFSMAGASLFLPYLPMLPKQILVTNLLTDFPELSIATDKIDVEMVEKPMQWDLKFIRRFMIVFGSVSSVFDYLTFGALFLFFHANVEQLRTAWLTESVISASAAVLMIRTRRPFFKSRPSRSLLLTTLLIMGVVGILPLTPVGAILGLVPLSLSYYGAIGLIVLLYIVSLEGVKKVFYARITK